LESKCEEKINPKEEKNEKKNIFLFAGAVSGYYSDLLETCALSGG
jgi:SpoU rRNA methylase family enzyme